MAEPLEQQLVFDIAPALASIQSVDEALAQVAANFGTALSSALDTLSSATFSIDTGSITSEVAAAVADAASTPVAVQVDADTTAATSAVDELSGDAQTVPVDADTASATTAIDAIATEPVVVPVEADTSAADAAISDLGDTASGTTGNVNDLSGATDGLSSVSALAGGSIAGATGILKGVSPAAAEAAVGISAVTGFLGKTVLAAADAEAQGKRFNLVFGDMADKVRQIDVGGLNVSLEELGRESGTTVANLEASASKIGQLGNSAGAAPAQIRKTTDELLAIGATASVTNPRLGDTSVVVDGLSRAMLRGGARLAQYGISLTSAQIQTEALKETGKAAASELTNFDKITAATTLTVDQFGSKLGLTFAAGSQNAQVQLRALKVALDETFVAIGRPLLQPVITTFADLLPIAQQLGIVLGNLGQVILPLLAGLGPLLIPVGAVLKLVSDGLAGVALVMDAIPSPIITVVGALAAFALIIQTVVVPALGELAFAGTLALGPAGWVTVAVGLLALLGGAFDLFGGKSHQAVADTTALDQAFQTTDGSISSLTSTFAALNKAVDDYLKKALAAKSGSESQLDAANKLGVGYHQISTALTGTSRDFQAFIVKLADTDPAFTAANGAAADFYGTLITGRATLQQHAHDAIATAISLGELTDGQLKAAQASNHASAEEHAESGILFDSIAILKELGPLIDANANRTNASALAAAQAAPAYGALVQQLASGKITVDTFSGSLEQFGFTSDVAASFAKNLQSAIQGIVSTSVGALPSAKTAISDYASTVKSDLDAVNSAVQSHKGDVGGLFKQLELDSDPSVFTQHLLDDAAAIAGFSANLAKVAAVAPELALQIGQAGPVAGAKLAEGFASDTNKAKVAEGALTLADTATNNFTAGVTARTAAYEASGAKGATAVLAGIAVTINADGTVPAATEALVVRATSRFNPDFGHRVTPAIQAAANALAADGTVSSAAAEKGLEAVNAFEARFGPITAGQAVTIGLKGAHDALASDSTLAVASGSVGDRTGKAFKPDIAGQARAALAGGVPVVQNAGALTTAAGFSGHEVGVGFGSGLAEGLADSTGTVVSAANALAAKLPTHIKLVLQSQSPSKVAIGIGRDFTAGLAIGLADTSQIQASGTVIASQVATSTSTALSGFGTQVLSNVVAGFNDPATIDAGIKKLQDLVAKATATATATATASTFSSAISQLPGAATAISAFGSNVSQAAAAQTSAYVAVHKAFGDYADDQKKHAALAAGLIPALDALHIAQARLFNDTLAKAPPFTLGIDKAEVKSAQSLVDGLNSKLSSSSQSLLTDQGNIATSANALTVAQKALATASNPDAFIKNLNAQTAANRRFENDLRRLTAEGAKGLAEQLAQAGPVAAGKLADGLASSPAKAKAAQAAIASADAFTKQYQAFIEKEFAPKVATSASSAGIVIGGSIGAGISTSTSTAGEVALHALTSKLGTVSSTIRISADTRAVTSSIAALPTSAAITVQPTLDLRSLPTTLAPLGVVVEPHLALPLPALAQIAIDVEPHLDLAALPAIPPLEVLVEPRLDPAPLAPVALEVTPHLDALPPLLPLTVDIQPRLATLPPLSPLGVNVEPTFDLKALPTIPPIGVTVEPELDPFAPALTVAVTPTLGALPTIAPIPVALDPTIGPLPPLVVTVDPVLGPLPPLTVVVDPVLEPLAPIPVEVEPHVLLPLPALAPLHVEVIPHLQPPPTISVAAAPSALTATAAGTPTTPPVPQILELDLDLEIRLPSGEVATASPKFQIPSSAGKQILRAQVDAAVRA